MRYLVGFVCLCALGVVPLLGCSETSGDGGSGGSAGTGGMSKGACTNQEDLPIVCASEFVDEAWNCGSEALVRCGLGTGGQGGDTSECRSEIASQCFHEDMGMSADCGDCFGDIAACVLASCESCVSGVSSQECHACRAENCNDALYGCTGDIVSGCDGEVWCQRVDCDDYVDCTENVCNPTDGVCGYPAVADGASCAGGMCQVGTCALTDTVLPCTEQGIRNAVAAGEGPYTFDCDGETRVVTKAEIIIDKDVILEGGGEMIVDGDYDHRVFSIVQGTTVELSGFVITAGVATEGREDLPDGAGIFNRGTLKLSDCIVEGNGDPARPENDTPTGPYDADEVPSETRGAGIFNDGTLTLANTMLTRNVGRAGGGIFNDGVLSITESTLWGNTAGPYEGSGGGIHNTKRGTASLTNVGVEQNSASSGGGIYNDGTLLILGGQVWANSGDERGGGIWNEGTAILTNAEVSGNDGGEIGGGIDNLGTLTLINSTVSSNHADLAGGIFNTGTLTLMRSTVWSNGALVLGGIWNELGGTFTATNSTISGNGAQFLVGSIFNDGTLTLTNSTVSGNGEDLASDILNTGLLTVTNSLVDGDCNGVITSNGYNIESPGDTCGFDTNKGDQVSVTEQQLKLGELADNGGPTMTHALLPGSVAIDVVPANACQVDTDQRGEPRPTMGGTMCDVGAFEVQP